MTSAFLVCLASLSPSALPEKVSLNGLWALTQADRHLELPAVVPGMVQSDLVRDKVIPDPFVGRNIRDVQWVGELSWTYRRNFQVTPEFAARKQILLRCEGLDTIATVSVNGHALPQADNMFRTWEWDVKPYLHEGQNDIRVDLEPPSQYFKEIAARPGKFGKPMQSGGWSYLRKAPFQQGWDFAPRLLTTGIWRDVDLVGWNEGRITDVGVTQDHSVKGQVGLTVKMAAQTSQAASAKATVLYKSRKVAEETIPLTDGHAEARLIVKSPHLWWPNDMGPQSLYNVDVSLKDAKGVTIDTKDKRIGLRTIQWLPKTDKSPLTLMVNGRRFFARGSNWVPPNSLIAPNTPEHTRYLVQKAVDAHMNLMRLWGGGVYEPDDFFNVCDEKGLLVWFEFKYADAAYPSFDPEWLANARTEAEDNVRRVRNHPSIAIFSGNNEVIGFIRDKTSESSMSRGEYNLLFHQTLRDLVHDLAPDASYTPGSPEVGDDHYWDVWHGSAGFSSYRDRHGFMSEYGFQSFPVPESVDAFTTAADRSSVETPTMLEHQKNWRDGNALITGSVLRYFRKPKDFDSTLWLGQINQADGILMGVEQWRRDWPNSTASLVWQFDDPWPVTSWSMIDFYGRPKALYYRLKHAYAPVALSGLADEKTGTVRLWVVNDRPIARAGQVEWKLEKTDGSVVSQGVKKVQIAVGTSSTSAAELDLSKEVTKIGPSNLLLWAKLHATGEPDSEATLVFGKPKDCNLMDPQIATTITPAAGGYNVTLRSAKPALDAWVDLDGSADYSDNFLTLIPGVPETITILTKEPIDEVRQKLKARSLFDTYAPGTEATPITLAQPNGAIVATADNAEILGDGPILESGSPDNIGNWQNVSDGLRWTVRNAKPGRYQVTATVSIPSAEAGSKFQVMIGGSRVTGEVPGTKGWTDYVPVKLGTVDIDASGQITIDLQPTSKPHDHVMNLRSLTLTPQ